MTFDESPAATVRRELGFEVRVSFTQTQVGFWWCRLELAEYRFTCKWVCCPGQTKETSLANAISQAKMHRKERVAA